MVMFPDIPVATRHYHQNAALLLLVSLVLLRLRGLGGTGWLAFYGGLGLMGGSYFLLTAFPGLSPFGRPLPAAWVAILSAQFWIMVSYERSPLRTGIQQMARLDDPAWHRLRHAWGLVLLAAVHGAGAWGLFDPNSRPHLIAPLVAGVASVLMHQEILRRSPVYLALGGLELGVALHLDFLTPSWLGKGQVIWVLLALFAGLRGGSLVKPGWFSALRPGPAAAGLGALIFAHVLYHHPWSATGLWAFGLLALLAASHPVSTCPSSHEVERASAWLLLVVPVWLVYFSQAPLDDAGLRGALQPWPVFTASLALLVVGLHSVMFAYLGCQDRQSPFTLVALGGFVLFVLLTFWTKLHFQALHAYIIPVGLGVLGLVHLLQDRIGAWE